MNIQEPRLSDRSLGSDHSLRQPGRGRSVLVFGIVAVILAVVAGAFLYFNYIFKPKMIAQAMSAARPPATLRARPLRRASGSRNLRVPMLVALRCSAAGSTLSIASFKTTSLRLGRS